MMMIFAFPSISVNILVYVQETASFAEYMMMIDRVSASTLHVMMLESIHVNPTNYYQVLYRVHDVSLCYRLIVGVNTITDVYRRKIFSVIGKPGPALGNWRP